MAIDPNITLKEGQRISVPHELMSQIVATLGELPARMSMDLILSIRQEAEVLQHD